MPAYARLYKHTFSALPPSPQTTPHHTTPHHTTPHISYQGIQRCQRKPQAQNAYLYNALAVMAAELSRVEEARAWFEEGTSSVGGGASVALWQAWAVLEARQGDPTAVRYLFKKALTANPRSR
jgi:hypothetical protein